MLAKTQLQAIPKSPQWLSDYREKNLQIFVQRPVKKSKYTNISSLEEMLLAKENSKNAFPKIDGTGAKIISFEELSGEALENIKYAISKEEPARDQFEAYINAYFNTGFVLMLGKEAHGKTIKLLHTLENFACIKYFIIAQEEIEVTVIEEIECSGTALCAQTVLVKDGANLSLVRLHHETAKAITYQQNIIERNAKIYDSNNWFSGDLIRANTNNILNGPGSEAHEYGILYGKKSSHFDINYSSIHRAGDCFSYCMQKSCLQDKSSSVFDGMIRIEESAPRTNALLECHAILLSENASSNQIPGLEIKTDDVKATHSATVSKIEEEEIFYLQSRGIAREDAKNIIVRSFLESVAYMLPMEAQKALLEYMEKTVN